MIGLVHLLAALCAGQSFNFESPPQQRGDIEARLRVDVPEEGPGPGRGRLRLTLTFAGPPGLQVQGPRLEDALAAWRVVRRASSWREEGGRAAWSLTLQLDQTKPGQVPPPGVVVRVRGSLDVPWQEVAWLDLLNESRDVPPPDELPPLPASPWPARLRWGAVALVCALVLIFLLRAIRRRRAKQSILSPDLRALARLEPPALPSGACPAERFAHAESVVRDYLDEQWGLKTRQQTAGEVLAASAELPFEAREGLRELFARGELVKFAGQAPGREECDQAIELARQVVRTCASAVRVSGEDAKERTPRKSAPAG